MLYSRLAALPLGSIKATGFLRDQLLRNKEGMGGHLDELEPDMIANPYIKRKYVDGWDAAAQAGWGAEISGNYWAGLIELAFSLGDDCLIKKATAWVDAVLKNQRDDGYLGTYDPEHDDMFADYNAWGTACGMRALLAFYEATKREDVIEAVHRCMLWFCKNWAGDRKTSYAGAYIIEPMVFCYRITGDERLIRFAEEYSDFLCAHDIFNTSYKTFLNEPLRYNCDHTAGMGIHSRLPALLYTVTGNSDYLKASEKILDEVYRKATHLSGSPVSVTEYLAPVTSTAETEYCSYAFFHTTDFYLSYITGNSKYGDRMEEMFYNGAQGARKKDERAIAYLSAPNQIYATEHSSSAFTDMQAYSPCYPTSCCPVNSVALLGDFVRSMFLTDSEKNIYANVYGPCSLCHDGVIIEEVTEYPFRNKVRFEIKKGQGFSLFLRIPDWCEAYSVFVNGKAISAAKNENGFAETALLKEGDTVEITFSEEIKVIRVNDDYKKHPIAIKRGALLYAFHIEEIWTPYPGRPSTPLPEGWSWFRAEPKFDEADCRDMHERLGLRKNQITWNIALDESLSPDDIKVELCENEGYVWENPMVKLHLTGFKAPYLCAPYPIKTFEPFGDRQPVTHKIDITLVPYGCTNLRITYFPIAENKFSSK